MNVYASMHLEAGEMMTAKVSPNGNTYASVSPGNAIHFASPAHGIANGLGIALDLLPELDHVGLVGVRFSLDAMSDRVTALMAAQNWPTSTPSSVGLTSTATRSQRSTRRTPS
jgi:hypothetical protein